MRTKGSTPLEVGTTQLADSEAREELRRRESNGIAVSLLWGRHSKTPQRPWTNPGVTR
jgi:hypothetical protein